MSGPDRRGPDRRGGDRRVKPGATDGADASRALVPVGEVFDADPADPAARRADPAGPDAAFTAQVMGQTGRKRGLKGGPPVLDAARSAYMETEYSGPRDRRPATGKAKRTEA